MQKREIGRWMFTTSRMLACAVALAGGVVVRAQDSLAPAAAPAKKTATKAGVPRTAKGRPDLSGPWGFGTLTPLERPKEFGDRAVLTDKEVAEIEHRADQTKFEDYKPRAGDPGTYNRFWTDFGSRVVDSKRTSLVIDPPDGRIPPVTPAAQTRDDAAWAKRQAAAQAQDLPSWDRCITGFNAGPPILPSGYNNNLHIFQSDNTVAIVTEMVHDARIIPVDNRPKLSEDIRLWRGSSRGRWEGDTLVVETTNFSNKGTGTLVLDRQFGPRAGLGGTPDEHFRLIERFTRVDRDTLTYEFTMNDPTVWTTPWTVSTTMRNTGERMFEYACHEGNYALPGMLSAARASEKAGGAKPTTAEGR
jgi:hypothetical protein